MYSVSFIPIDGENVYQWGHFFKICMFYCTIFWEMQLNFTFLQITLFIKSLSLSLSACRVTVDTVG